MAKIGTLCVSAYRRLYTTNGYADLTDESRKAVDQIIGMILKGQARNP